MPMTQPVRFYFDFNSTFSYIAIQRIDELAARYGREVDWRVISLGHLFVAQNIVPPPTIPAKLAYLAKDFARSCEFVELPGKVPQVFPPDVKLARLTFWHLKAQSEPLARAFAKAVSMAAFGYGRDVATIDELMAACSGVNGVTREHVVAASEDAQAKRRLVESLKDAVADGMVGAPFFVLDDEPFWGADRMDHLERRLKEKRG
jgi:2-hydroxychromene-2-carboxylate isomerase